MDNNTYIIIIILITIFILIYGGHNNISKIEYNNKYFEVYNIIKIFEKKIQNFDLKNDLKDNIVNMKDYIPFCEILLPNLIDCFYIKILPYNYMNINIIKKYNTRTNLFVIYNHDKINNLDLIVKVDNNIGYFYDIKKKISITDIYPIYNNSNEIIFFSLFIIKKPWWLFN